MTGFENLEPGRNLEVTPTVTAGRMNVAPGLPGLLEAGDEDVEAGLSARWGITPNVSLSGTINPDFSQVEADVAQTRGQRAFRPVLPREAAVLPRRDRLFLDAAWRRSSHARLSIPNGA